MPVDVSDPTRVRREWDRPRVDCRRKAATSPRCRYRRCVPGPLIPPATLPPLLVGGLALLCVWLTVSIAVQWGALHASRLARRSAPACFRAAVPGPGPGVDLAFLGDLQRGVLDVPLALAEALPREGVDLLISSGDFVSHGEGPYYGVLLAAFERAGLTTPVRVVPGNHDLWPRRSKDDRIGGAEFARAFGPRHWALRTGPVLVVGVDNGANWLVDEQLPWLEQTLDAHADTPWICVCHRPPFRLDEPGAPTDGDLAGFVALLRRRPPLLVVAGHMHTYHDATVDGVRVIVNAHGGDVHGLALRRADFELLHVRVDHAGIVAEPRRYRRKRDWRTARDQLAVRFWADRRKRWGALLGWPAGLVLRLLGRSVPVTRVPEERRVPEQAVLDARRKQPLETP